MFESLRINPELELPDWGPNYTEDLRALCDEVHDEGLYRVTVHKMLRRNTYEPIATIMVQDNPTRGSRPTASVEEICEMVMLIIQYEIEKSDDPGKYKITFYMGRGRSGKQRSKHVDMSDPEGEAKSMSLMNEGELIEQQTSYISELHSQNINHSEITLGIVKQLASEFKDMVKVIGESQRTLADVEAMKLKHELELKVHNDDIKQKEMELQAEQENKERLFKMIADTGALDIMVKSAAKWIAKKQKDNNDDEKEGSIPSLGEPKQNEEKERFSPEEKEEKKGKKSKRKSEKKENVSENTKVSEEEERQFFEEGEQFFQQTPLKMAAQTLAMSLQVKEKTELIKNSLNEEQWNALQKVFNAKDDDEVKKYMEKLSNIQPLKNLIRLSDHLDEDEQKFVDLLLQEVIEN